MLLVTQLVFVYVSGYTAGLCLCSWLHSWFLSMFLVTQLVSVYVSGYTAGLCLYFWLHSWSLSMFLVTQLVLVYVASSCQSLTHSLASEISSKMKWVFKATLFCYQPAKICCFSLKVFLRDSHVILPSNLYHSEIFPRLLYT